MSKLDTYPYRPPKRVHQEVTARPCARHDDPYDDYRRAVLFYSQVFGWDMMRVPQGVFIEDSDERPHLMCATGPSQVSWEASVPGHVWAQLVARERVPKVQTFTEVSMDVPLAETSRP